MSNDPNNSLGKTLQRWLKIAIFLAVGLLVLSFVALAIWGGG